MKAKIFIFNGTPNSINIIDPSSIMFDGKSRKYISMNEKVVTKIPSNFILNVNCEMENAEPINGIPTIKIKIVSIDELPVGYDYYIVSAPYLAAAKSRGKDTSNLLTIGEPVYSSDGLLRPIGAAELQRN